MLCIVIAVHVLGGSCVHHMLPLRRARHVPHNAPGVSKSVFSSSRSLSGNTRVQRTRRAVDGVMSGPSRGSVHVVRRQERGAPAGENVCAQCAWASPATTICTLFVRALLSAAAVSCPRHRGHNHHFAERLN